MTIKGAPRDDGGKFSVDGQSEMLAIYCLLCYSNYFSIESPNDSTWEVGVGGAYATGMHGKEGDGGRVFNSLVMVCMQRIFLDNANS